MLPTKLSLFKRHVVTDSLCEQCRDLTKDSVHALWLCDSAKAIWMSDQCFSSLRSKKFSTFEDVFHFLCGEFSSKSMELFSMVVWSIWERQNQVQERQQVWGIDEVCHQASTLLKEFYDVHKKIPRMAI